MGALQLTYEPNLKIVHRTGKLIRSHEAKSVQLWLSVDPLAEKRPHHSPYIFCGNNPLSNIDPDGRYFFGLFGSSSDQRKQMRAERFAEKVGGTVVSNQNGNPSVNYNFQNSSDGTLSFTNKSNFGDFKSWKNVKETLVGFIKVLDKGGTNYGNGDGEYTNVVGMYEAADMLDNSGSNLSCIPGEGQVVGAIASMSADGLRTIADYSGGVTTEQANANLAVRVTLNLAGEKIGNDIKSAEFSKGKEYIFNQSARILTDELKNQATTKPKEKSKD